METSVFEYRLMTALRLVDRIRNFRTLGKENNYEIHKSVNGDKKLVT